MSFEIKSIKIGNILLDSENPRLGSEVEGEAEDIIRAVAENQGRKLSNLAEDIVENGVSPAELLIAIRADDESEDYIVIEGNRRVAALQILADPSIINSIDEKYVIRKFNRLHDEFNKDPIQEISCAVADSRKEAAHWIELRHAGELDGAGTVRWGTEEKERWYNSSKPLELQVLDFVKEEGGLDEEASSNIGNVATTNLKRLVGDPYVRGRLGIDMKKGQVLTEFSKENILPGLERIVSDLALKNIDINDIRHKEDRNKYINSISEDIEARDGKVSKLRPIAESAEDYPLAEPESNEEEGSTEADDKPENGDTTSGDQNDKEPDEEESGDDEDDSDEDDGGNRKERPSPESRKTLIPSSIIFEIGQPRINVIYKELKKLNVNRYPNAASVLMRVFLELSLDHFVKENPVTSVGKDPALAHKLNRATAFMKNRNWLTPDQAKAVFRLASDDMLLAASIGTMHSYVHNRHFKPSPLDLKTAWDNIELFLDKIWHED